MSDIRHKPLVKAVYNILLNDIILDNSCVNWVGLVKNLLCTSGFSNVWEQGGVGDTEMFLRVFERRTQDMYLQTWHTEIHESNRAITFKWLCPTFEYKKYLDVLTVTKIRLALTRLRLSSHRLCVETGRWQKPCKIPYEDRKCTFCNLLEDEFHFILECKVYNDLRRSIIPRYYRQHPSMYKFVDLMTSDNKKLMEKVALYVYKATLVRNDVLYNNSS